MRGVTELLNKGRLNARGEREEEMRSALTLTILHAVILQSRNGLLMHYSSANAASAARVLPRCCALTCPKLQQHNVRETSEERSLDDAHRNRESCEQTRGQPPLFRTCTKICVMCITHLNIQILTILSRTRPLEFPASLLGVFPKQNRNVFSFEKNRKSISSFQFFLISDNNSILDGHADSITLMKLMTMKTFNINLKISELQSNDSFCKET